MKNTFNYKVLADMELFDEKNESLGNFEAETVHEFPEHLGDRFVEEGKAVLIDDKEAVTTARTTADGDARALSNKAAADGDVRAAVNKDVYVIMLQDVDVGADVEDGERKIYAKGETVLVPENVAENWITEGMAKADVPLNPHGIA